MKEGPRSSHQSELLDEIEEKERSLIESVRKTDELEGRHGFSSDHFVAKRYSEDGQSNIREYFKDHFNSHVLFLIGNDPQL